MRAVLDTGVLISGLIRPQGVPGQVLGALRDGDFRTIYSVPILLEVIDVLDRPKLRQKYNLRVEDIAALVDLIRLRGELVSPSQLLRVCRDPKDDKFLEAALAGQADVIVSGDGDLLALHPYQGIAILSPANFLRLLEGRAAIEP